MICAEASYTFLFTERTTDIFIFAKILNKKWGFQKVVSSNTSHSSNVKRFCLNRCKEGVFQLWCVTEVIFFH